MRSTVMFYFSDADDNQCSVTFTEDDLTFAPGTYNSPFEDNDASRLIERESDNEDSLIAPALKWFGAPDTVIIRHEYAPPVIADPIEEEPEAPEGDIELPQPPYQGEE